MVARKKRSRKPQSKHSSIDKRMLGIEAVINDGRPKCTNELNALKRQLNDLEFAHERGFIWDEEEASRNVEFFKLLKHFQGSYAGKPFILEPWQEHGVVGPIFGWHRQKLKSKGGLRRFQIAGVEISRKNGKTMLAAGMANQGLIADKESGPEVYSAASAAEQASITFRYARDCLGPELAEMVKVYQHSLAFQKGFFQPVSSQYHVLDGRNVHRCIIDELHQHKSRDVWDIMVNATAARFNSLIFWISYAGFDRQSIWWDQHTWVERILSGAEVDDSYFGYLTGIDEGDDWQDPMTWWKANPQLKISMDETKFEAKAQRAATSPLEENDFRRVHLNQVVEQSVRWMPMHHWDNCSRLNPSVSFQKEQWEDELVGRPCYGGLDLASTRDLCAWALVFPWDDGSFRTKVRYYAPNQAINERAAYDQKSYATYAGKGLIEVTEGTGTDYNVIMQQMTEDRHKYDLRCSAFDPRNMMKSYHDLISLGWSDEELIQFDQNYSNFNEPMGRFLELILKHQFDHGNDEVLRWMATNMTVKQDGRGYIRPDKEKSQDKIDGLVAVIMGYAMALAEEGTGMIMTYEPGSLML